MENQQIQRLPRDIEHCFGFLYDRGFRLRQVDHAEWLTGNWTVIFASWLTVKCSVARLPARAPTSRTPVSLGGRCAAGTSAWSAAGHVVVSE